MFLTVVLTFNLCVGQESRHSELKHVYADLVEAFQAENDQALKVFCYKLAADESTLEYMRENNLCYRGMPCKMSENRVGVKTIGDEFFQNLLRVRNSLMSDGLLDSLAHIDSTKYKCDIVIIVNEMREGYDKPISQNDFSISKEKYTEALLKAASLGKTLDEFMLNGKEGDVYVIKGTEMSIRFRSGDKIIEYPLGEMVLINEKWSLFTKPNVDYYVRENVKSN